MIVLCFSMQGKILLSVLIARRVMCLHLSVREEDILEHAFMYTLGSL
jgi:hypothetical protein